MRQIREVHLCPLCSEFVPIKEDGTMAPHRFARGFTSAPCKLGGLSKLQARLAIFAGK